MTKVSGALVERLRAASHGRSSNLYGVAADRIERLEEALIDWHNSWLCPATDFEQCTERLLANTRAALRDDAQTPGEGSSDRS